MGGGGRRLEVESDGRRRGSVCVRRVQHSMYCGIRVVAQDQKRTSVCARNPAATSRTSCHVRACRPLPLLLPPHLRSGCSRHPSSMCLNEYTMR